MKGIDFLFIFTAWIMFLFIIDDLIIQFLIILKKAHPKLLTKETLYKIKSFEQKPLAIMIANWQEDNVLKDMIYGNIHNISYSHYSIFLGVYPNDIKTKNMALELEKKFNNVHTVINTEFGPTSKGQMLNQIILDIFRFEKINNIKFELFLLHDSEDILHPDSLSLVNYYSKKFDFIQTPVFSFETKTTEFTAGTYMDEFAEHHCGEMILRSKLKQAIPSAGTGTAMSRKVVLKILENQNNLLFNPGSLTEDYIIGNQSFNLGFSSAFLCFYKNNHSKKEFIATYEYFPSSFYASIKQKTRWCIGIIFQSPQLLTKSNNGKLLSHYFKWRDKRGLFNSILITLGLFFTLYYGVIYILNLESYKIVLTPISQSLLILNFFGLLLRVFFRMKSVYSVYSFQSAFYVSLRWWVANIINTVSCFRGGWIYYQSIFLKTPLTWTKTDHKLPESFKNHFNQPIIHSSENNENKVLL